MNKELLVHTYCVIVLAAVWIYIAMALFSGCSTTQPLPVQTAIDCPPTEIVNNTTEWTASDELQMIISKQECKRRFGPQTCLKVLTKVRKNGYTILCRGVQ